MNPYPSQPPPQQSQTPTVDAKTLWSAGIATAVVAALIAVIGVLIVRDLFNTPVISPLSEHASQIGTLVAYSVGAAIVATALLHLLLLSTPTAITFFGWICALCTIVAVILPFAQWGTIGSKVGSAIIYFVIGAAITSLLSGAARSAVRRGALGPTQSRR